MEVGCKHFLTVVKSLYSGCLEYLDMWIEPIKEFSCFKWMELENVSWTEVESSIKYMMDKDLTSMTASVSTNSAT